MAHHGVVDQHDAQALAVRHPQWFRLGELEPVEGPRELLHVPGQVQLNRASRVPSVGIGERASEIRVGQDAAAVVAQADAGIIQLRRGCHGLHVHQRVVGFAGGVGLHPSASHVRHRSVAMVHASHRARICRHVVACMRIGADRCGRVGAGHGVTRMRVRGGSGLWGLHRTHVVAGVHVAMPHVGHAQDRTGIQWGDRRAQAFAHRQGAADVAGTRAVLGEEGVSVLPTWLHDDIKGFRRRDAQLVHRHRMHRLAIGGHHGQLQPGDAHVEVGHRRAVDQAQPHLVAGGEHAGPVAQRGGAVEQVGVGLPVDVGQVGRGHAHLPPHLAVGDGGGQAVALRIAHEIADGALVDVVVAGHFLEPREQLGGVHIGPVGQHHHVIAVAGDGVRSIGVDHQRPVHAALFLEPGMAVVPVSASLFDVEPIEVALARADAVEAHAGHAVHVRRQQYAVPVDRGVRAVDGAAWQLVAHAQGNRRALFPAQQRAGHGSIDGDRGAGAAGVVDQGFTDAEVELRPAQGRHRVRRLCPACARPQAQAGNSAARGQALNETSPRRHGDALRHAG